MPLSPHSLEEYRRTLKNLEQAYEQTELAISRLQALGENDLYGGLMIGNRVLFSRYEALRDKFAALNTDQPH
jgi:hypothetical protein